MVTGIHKWGDSLAVRDDICVAARGGTIVIAPNLVQTERIRRIRGKQSLEELLSRIPEDFKPEEADWGKPVGREAW